MERYTPKIIPLAGIRREFPFRCRYRNEVSPALVDSVKRRGILSPLVTAGAATIVSGHRRLQAAAQLGITELPVLDLPQSLSREDLFIAALIGNWNQGLTDLDRAWALRLAVETFHINEAALEEEVLPCLGLAAGHFVREEFLSVARLDRALLDAIAAGSLPFRGAKILSKFSAADQREFAAAIVPQCSLTTNQLLNAGQWLLDLVRADRTDLATDLAAFLSRPLFSEILQDENSNRRMKAERLCESLFALRFPRVADRKKRFEAFARGIDQETGDFWVEAPASFEAEGFVLRAKIREPESLDRLAELVSRKRSVLNALFDIIL